jgi:hypothetical protein
MSNKCTNETNTEKGKISHLRRQNKERTHKNMSIKNNKVACLYLKIPFLSMPPNVPYGLHGTPLPVLAEV